MKKFMLVILLFSYIFTGVYAAKNDAVCDKYVRLHILANSNSAFDQAVKIKVKNYLLKSFENEFSSFKSKEETIDFIDANKDKIKNYIDSYLKNMNIYYSSDIRIIKEEYGKSNFENLNLPKGVYTSVKISLGKGKGKNLFFIMFPALSIKEGLTVKTDNGNKVKYKSKILELITR